MWFTVLPTPASSITDNSKAEIKKNKGLFWLFGGRWILALPSSSILHRTFEKQDISFESDIHYQFGQRASEPVLSANDL